LLVQNMCPSKAIQNYYVYFK